jgi:large subunit ribosomal protein L15
MMIHEITNAIGAHKRRKRVGRGECSGLGKTSGRGNKGCQSRAGGGTRPLHEGGQMPIFRRLPKRGFSNVVFSRRYEILNIKQLEERFNDGDKADLAAMRQMRLLRAEPGTPVKILGYGTLTKKLTVAAHAFSPKAREAIEQAGGKVELLERRDPAELARAKRNSKRGDAPKAAKKAKPAPAAVVKRPAPAGPPRAAETPADGSPAAADGQESQES